MTPLNEQAYNYLQKLIMENHFSYQEVYSETKLSKELGISRTPLRDAVHRLAQEGYIVNETFQVRSALETYCTVQISKDSSTRKAKKLFKELDWIMECMNDIMETTHSIKEFSEYDFQFHTKIIDYLENEQFSNVFAMFMYRMKRLAELSLAHKGRMEQTYEEHMAILDCMKNGDTSHIYEITLKHMETPRDINLEDL